MAVRAPGGGPGQFSSDLDSSRAQLHGDHGMAGVGEGGGGVPRACAEFQHPVRARPAEALDGRPAGVVHSGLLGVGAPPLGCLVVEVHDPVTGVLARSEQ